MSELRERLNKVKNRLDELENTPSELTRDALLTDLRELYDAVKLNEVITGVKRSMPNAEQELEEEQAVEPEPVQLPDETEEEEMPRPAAETVVAKTELDSIVDKEEQTFEHPQDEMKEEIVIPDPPIFEEVEDPILTQRRSLIGTIEDSEKPNDKEILAGQLSNKPLEDLRTGIPLNEKFGIIRGLFAGNASDFGDAVLKLNNAKTIKEMQHYLEIMEQRFKWDVDSEPYRTFSVYVERKMMTLEFSNANADQ